MSLLVARGLTKYYGAQEVFADISVQVSRGDKIGLVGPNGVGKTTLLRILAGLEEPTSGSVHTARRLRIGYLPQNPDLRGDGTLYDEMLTAFEHLRVMEQRLHDLELAMSDTADVEGVMRRYSDLLEQFEAAGGYVYESQIRRVLAGLGFEREQHDQPLSLLSGGQKTRALLAKLLLQEPELLLLDEPTNYLDIEALEWLEGYLAEWPYSLIVVAHDRRFLDKVTNRIWEMGGNRLEKYRGNYSQYVLLKEARRAHREAEYRAQQEYIAKTEEFIRRYRAGQRAREARGRQKLLNRMERLEKPRQSRTIRLSMEATVQTGQIVLTTRDLIVGYPKSAPDDANPPLGQEEGEPRVLFTCPDITLLRGERVVLMGPNGSGKTTFLRTILGETPPLRGHITLGHNVRIGYLEQERADLDPSATVLDFILTVKNLPISQARDFLAQYLFTGDDVFKRIQDLSGGERARVALAAITLKGANLLLLDEPTTHLDLTSQEVLQQVLANFSGTFLLVSHDRYLANAVATQIWEIREHTLHTYQGDYEAYLFAREKERMERQTVMDKCFLREPSADAVRTAPRSRLLRRLEEEISNMEERIAELEAEILGIQKKISAASASQDLNALQEFSKVYQQMEQELNECLERWAELQTRRHVAQ